MTGIFKAYDIRGKYTGELNEDIAKDIGKAIATFLQTDTIVVGRDNRISSDSIFSSLTQGIRELGVSIVDIGVVSTPMAYFAVNHLDKKGLIMVTASHNSKEYNGFKLTREKAIPISGETGIADIERLFFSKEFKRFSQNQGRIETISVEKEYFTHLSKFVKGIAGLKVVVDCGNGVMGPLVHEFFSHLYIEMIPLHFERDGNYPFHDPNPMILSNVKELQEAVKSNGANLGIAFDGDGDRVVFVDDKSAIVPSDFVTALLAEQLVKPGDIVLYDLRSSWVVKETIQSLRGKAEMSKVGHSLIKEHMRKVNAVFAGELSGHYYFRDNFFTDSGFITALEIMSLVSSKGKLSQLVKPLQKYVKIQETNFEVENPDEVLKCIEERYSSLKTIRLDGISIESDQFWFNIRKSNTEPIVRLNMEAKRKDILEKIKKELAEVIGGKFLP